MPAICSYTSSTRVSHNDMGPVKCCRTAFSPPEVWCAQTAEELKSFPVDYNILSPDIYSAHSGPDEGVKFVKCLLSKEDCTNNNSKQDTGKSVW